MNRDLGVFHKEAREALVEHLLQRSVVVLSTDTLPGLSALPEALCVRRIQELKGRPESKPFILLCSDWEMVLQITDPPPQAEALAQQFWPGPLSMLLPRKEGVLQDYFPDFSHLAVRVPGHEGLRILLSELDSPLVSTSINTSGEPPAASVSEIESFLAEADASLPRLYEIHENPLASTLVDFPSGDEVRVLRGGSISASRLQQT